MLWRWISGRIGRRRQNTHGRSPCRNLWKNCNLIRWRETELRLCAAGQGTRRCKKGTLFAVDPTSARCQVNQPICLSQIGDSSACHARRRISGNEPMVWRSRECLQANGPRYCSPRGFLQRFILASPRQNPVITILTAEHRLTASSVGSSRRVPKVMPGHI
jgi:hypothetical protein